VLRACLHIFPLKAERATPNKLPYHQALKPMFDMCCLNVASVALRPSGDISSYAFFSI